MQCRDDNFGTTSPIDMGQTQMDREFIGQQNELHGGEKYAARAEWCSMPIKTPVWGIFHDVAWYLETVGRNDFKLTLVTMKMYRL